jgi:hypothetical protein
MTLTRLGLVFLVVVLTACDPAATAYLRLRPVGEMGTPPKTTSVLQSVEVVLESFGFERKIYPPDTHEKFLAECGTVDYWMKSNRDATGSFGTYARVCLSDRTVNLSLSDWGRFSVSGPTKELKDSIAQSLRKMLSGMEITVE